MSDNKRKALQSIKDAFMGFSPEEEETEEEKKKKKEKKTSSSLAERITANIKRMRNE